MTCGTLELFSTCVVVGTYFFQEMLTLSRSPQSCSFSQSVPLLVMTHKRAREYLTCVVVMMMETQGGGLCT